MKVRECELDDMQALMIMTGIMQLKENEYFKDGIASEYQSLYSSNLALRATDSEVKQRLFPRFYKLKISENKLQYLMRLTGVNPFDEKEVEEFKRSLDEVNNEKLPQVKKL